MTAPTSSARISIRVQPRARRDELVAVREGVMLVRVTAPPLDGRANRAACRLLAERLRIAPGRVTVVRGEHSRDKVVEVDGLDQEELDGALGT